MRLNSFSYAATNFLLAALSKSGAQCAVSKRPSIASPTGHDVLVRAESGHDQWHVARQAGGDELLDEIDAHAAGQEDVERVGLGGAYLGELGRVIELPELRVDLGGHVAFVEALEAG